MSQKITTNSSIDSRVSNEWSWVIINHNYVISFRHVQVNNESAISFYQKFGFSIVETKPAYYKRIEPADAHVLLRAEQVSYKQKLYSTFGKL